MRRSKHFRSIIDRGQLYHCFLTEESALVILFTNWANDLTHQILLLETLIDAEESQL